MTSDKKANIHTGLHNWDSTILPVTGYLTAISFLPALAASTITPIAWPGIKPLVISFLIIELIWITWKGLKKTPGYIHAIVLILVAAIAAARSLADTGLDAGNFLNLFVIPIIIPFTAMHAGNFTFLHGLVLVFFGSFLINGGDFTFHSHSKKMAGSNHLVHAINNWDHSSHPLFSFSRTRKTTRSS